MTSGVFKTFCDQLHQFLEPEVRQHLVQVYTTMAFTCAFATLGTAIHLLGIWQAGLLSPLLQFASCLGLFFVPARTTNRKLRLALLLATGGLTGHVLGLTVEYALLIDPASVMTALLGSTFCFACLSVSAILAQRGSYLLMGGMLSNMVALVFLLSFGNLFLQSWFVYRTSLYLALVTMFGFVLLDTQQIVEDFRQGDDDYIIHSLKLFFGLVDMFRLLMKIFAARDREARRRRQTEGNSSN